MSSLDNIFGDEVTAPASAGAGPSLDDIFGPATPPVDPFAALKDKGGAVLPMPKMADTSKKFDDFLHYNGLSYQKPDFSAVQIAENQPLTKSPIVSKITGGTTLKQFGKNILTGLPKASAEVSDKINKYAIEKPADLLANTRFMQEAASGIDAERVTGNGHSGLFAQDLLHKLSYGLESISGVSGGLYKPPDNPEEDLVDKGLRTLSEGVGMAAGMSSLGSVALGAGAAAGLPPVGKLTQLLGRFPLASKYIAPFVQPLVENATGFGIYGQLDPNLGADMQGRVKKLATDIGTSPIYTAMGAIKHAGVSIPASFGLGYGMAKLSGASNEDAVAAGFAFSFLDMFGRHGEKRGLTASEIQENMRQEATGILQPFADGKITEKTSPEELKAIYYAAAHATHPDLGGSAEKFNSIKSAFDYLSKGQDMPQVDESIGLLAKSVRDTVAKHGEPAAHLALQEHLGLDQVTSARLVSAAKTPKTGKEIQVAHDKVAGEIFGARSDDQIKKDAEDYVEKNSDSLIERYIKEHKNFVGADEAKELMPGYSQDRSTSDLVQRGASRLAEKVYDHLLEVRVGEGNNTVLVTGGGTGVGKSTAIRGGGVKSDDYAVVFDTNLTDAPSGIKRIQKALDKGYDVDLHYVYAPPEESYKRVLERSENMTQKYGSGRPVSPQGHIDMHHRSYDALPAIMEHFKGNRRVRLALSDNSGKKPKLVKNPIDFIQKKGKMRSNETDLHAKLETHRQEAFKAGKISEKTHAAFERAGGLRPRREEQKVQQQSEQGDQKPPEDVLKILEKEVLSPAEAERLREFNKNSVAEVTPEPVKGTGDKKVRGLSSGIEAVAIQKKLTDEFGDLPEYEQVSMKEQAKLASELMQNDYELAKRIAMGVEDAPKGLLPEMVLVAVENKAILDRDIETLRMLATSSELSVAGTTMGQRIRALGERESDSPVKAITEVAKAREKKAGDVKKAKKETVKKIKEEIEKDEPDTDAWESFINEITC